MFEAILNDSYIIDLYKRIEIYEDLNSGWAYHNLNHVINVAKTVEEILKSLGYDNAFIDESKVAALLHDIGCIEGKENHEHRSYEMAKDYFESNNINLTDKDLVLDAIKLHRDGFDTDNVIARTLMFADKLDIKHDRLAKAGYTIAGLKELQYVKDIVVSIDNNQLSVKFVADERMNIKELEEFYFIAKVFKAIESFANVMNLEYSVNLNEDVWEPRF